MRNHLVQILRDALIKKLSYQQQIVYLERCFALGVTQTAQHDAAPSTLHQLWRLLKQGLPTWESLSNPEPQIQLQSDDAGHTWWHIHNPRTGQTLDLDSEEEVLIWIEEQLYR